MQKHLLIILWLLAASCKQNKTPPSSNSNNKPSLSFEKNRAERVYNISGDIPEPEGYKRVYEPENSFGAFLRKLPFKKDKTVYLWNGEKKRNQSAQFAVVDIPTGKKDLQQCADVVMRLRAEYLFAQKKYNSISFTDFTGKKYNWPGGNNRQQFDRYLENVFGWCGSASLEKQLKPVSNINDLQAGDVFIHGGFPGHAVIVVDVAVNDAGKKLYMLVQGYQPAQDMHLLVNPINTELSPWYEILDEETVYTPEWHFKRNELRRW
jgi:hypothetical protein